MDNYHIGADGLEANVKTEVYFVMAILYHLTADLIFMKGWCVDRQGLPSTMQSNFAACELGDLLLPSSKLETCHYLV